MRASPYNNPLFADGLANLVKGYIGNPLETAQAELYAAKALNENLTAGYRQNMDVGLEGDLSAMMIRALQAGPDYSRYAPSIATAVNRNNSGTLGALLGGGGGGRRGGSSKSGDFDGLSTSLRTTLRQFAKDNELTPETQGEIMNFMIGGLSDGTFKTEDEAWSSALSNMEFEETVTNKPGTMLTRLFGLDDGVPDEVVRGPVTGIRAPEGVAPDSVDILNKAREAIAAGADPAAVKQRLVDMGIDPGQL